MNIMVVVYNHIPNLQTFIPCILCCILQVSSIAANIGEAFQFYPYPSISIRERVPPALK